MVYRDLHAATERQWPSWSPPKHLRYLEGKCPNMEQFKAKVKLPMTRCVKFVPAK